MPALSLIRRLLRACAPVLLLALLPGMALARDAPVLRGAWLQAPASPAPPRVKTAALHPFDTARLVRPPRGPQGVWVRLLPARGTWPSDDRVLVIEHPGLGEVTLYRAGHVPQRDALESLHPGVAHTPGQLAFRLPALAGDAALWLYFAPNPWLGSSMHFVLRIPQAWARGAADWLAFTTAMLSVLVVMGLMALWFGLLLRDRAYLSYAMYVGAYALLSAVSDGYAFHPLELAWVAADPAQVARVAGGVAGFASILFAERFADLPGYIPWSRALLRGARALFAAIIVFSLAPWPTLRALGGWLQNPVVVVAGVLLLTMLVLAALRGGRYARLMLVGWSPLVLASVCGSLQAFGWLLDWTWLSPATLGAAGFEALVLIAGLADRTLSARRDHHQALRMAEHDALTGVLNRGALLARLRRLQTETDTPLSVLFIDLDHFKRLNDAAGHQAGDQALLALVRVLRLELREGDCLGRYGGEEFMVLLPGQSLSQALSVAERLLEAVRRRRMSARPDLPPLTISIGAAEAQPGEPLTHLLERADQAMYAAKRGGRDQVQAAGA